MANATFTAQDLKFCEAAREHYELFARTLDRDVAGGRVEDDAATRLSRRIFKSQAFHAEHLAKRMREHLGGVS